MTMFKPLVAVCESKASNYVQNLVAAYESKTNDYVQLQTFFCCSWKQS